MTQLSDIHTRDGLLKVINTLPLAITVIDKNLTVALANHATALFVNKAEDQLIGLVFGDALGCIHHDDTPQGCGFAQECIECQLYQIMQDTLKKKEPRQWVETTMVFKSQGKRHLRISTLPVILNNEGAVLLSVEDITLAKRHEQTRMEKERLAAAVETAGAVCHEINQPLMVIMGMAELLLEETEDSDSRKSGLAEIKAQSDRLGKITRKLMTLTEYKTRPYLKDHILDIQGEAPETPPDP